MFVIRAFVLSILTLWLWSTSNFLRHRASSNQLLVAESLVGGTDLGIHRACTYSRYPQQPHNPLHLRRRRRTNPNLPSCCSDSLLTASLSQQCPSRNDFRNRSRHIFVSPLSSLPEDNEHTVSDKWRGGCLEWRRFHHQLKQKVYLKILTVTA